MKNKKSQVERSRKRVAGNARRVFTFNIGLCVLAALFVAGLGLKVINANPTEVRGVERNVVLSAQRLLSSGEIYTDPEEPPFFVEQYSPLQYYLIAGGSRLLGIGAEDPAGITKVGRVLSALAHLAVLAVLWIFLRRVLSVRRLIAAGALGFYVVWAGLFPITVRPDSLAALLLISALSLLVVAMRDARADCFRAGIALGWFAGLAKQDAVVGVLLALGYVGWRAVYDKRYRVMLRPALAGTVFAIVAMTPFLFIYDVFALKANIVDGIANGFGIERAFKKSIVPFLPSGMLVVTITGIGWMRVRHQRNHLRTFLLVMSGGLLVLGVLTSLKEGTSVWKYSKFMLVGCPTAAYLLELRMAQYTTPRADLRRWAVFVTPLFLVALALNTKMALYDTLPALGGRTFQQNGALAAKVVEATKRPGARLVFRGNPAELLINSAPSRVWMPMGVLRGNYRKGSYDDTGFQRAVSQTPTFLVEKSRSQGVETLLSITPDRLQRVADTSGLAIYKIAPSSHEHGR